jgi:hypothetical protein
MSSEAGRHGVWSRQFKFLVLLIAVICTVANSGLAQETVASNTLATLRNQNGAPHRSWQIGVFAAGGFPPFYQITSPASHYTVDLNLLNAGIEAGKILTAAHGPGLLRGRGEAAIEVIPFWLADYPKQTQFIYFTSGLNGNTPMQTEWGPYRRYGASITPVLLRWNFMRRDASRVIPSAQLGGGLLWTNHQFPLLGGNTGDINFTPQVGIGQSVFIRKNQSLDFAIKAVHIRTRVWAIMILA